MSQAGNGVMERNGVGARKPDSWTHFCHHPIMGPWAYRSRCGRSLRNLDNLRALLDRECCNIRPHPQTLDCWELSFLFLVGGGDGGGEAEEKEIRKFVYFRDLTWKM